MKRSLASPSSVAHVMYQKYINSMPLNRQEKDWANQGVTLSRATLANWIIRPSHDWFDPLYKALKKYLITEPVVHADETVIQVLKEDERSRLLNQGCGYIPQARVKPQWYCLNTSLHVRGSMPSGFWKALTDTFKRMVTLVTTQSRK